jgi:hypothetical protein
VRLEFVRNAWLLARYSTGKLATEIVTVCATVEQVYSPRHLVHARKSRHRVGCGCRSAQATVEWYPQMRLELLPGVSITQYKLAMANLQCGSKATPKT